MQYYFGYNFNNQTNQHPPKDVALAVLVKIDNPEPVAAVPDARVDTKPEIIVTFSLLISRLYKLIPLIRT